MLCLQKPSQELISDFIFEQKDTQLNYSHVKATADYATKEQFLKDDRFKIFDFDEHMIKLGEGPETFRKAIDALKSWKPFFLDWVELCYPETPVQRTITDYARFFR